MEFALSSSLISEIAPHFNEESAELEALEINKMIHACSEAQQTLKQKRERSKQLIRDMTAGVKQLQEDVSKLKRGEEERDLFKKASEEQENARKQLEMLTNQKNNIVKELSQFDARKRDLNERMLELKRTKLVEIPLIKHALGLYANITGIRWIYDSERVAGYCVQGSDMKRFEINSEQSAFDLADELWNRVIPN